MTTDKDQIEVYEEFKKELEVFKIPLVNKSYYTKESVDIVVNLFISYIDECKGNIYKELKALKENISLLEVKNIDTETHKTLLLNKVETLTKDKIELVKKVTIKDKTISNCKSELKELKDELHGKVNKNSITQQKKLKQQADYILRLDKKILGLLETIENLKKENKELKRKK